jgi:hypothetical protein
MSEEHEDVSTLPPPPGTAVTFGRPDPEPVTPDARRRRRGATSTVVLVVLGVVAFVAAAAGTFVTHGTGTGTDAGAAPSAGLGPVPCDDEWCIPSLRAGAVFAALERRGFTCDSGCDLVAGSSSYTEQVVGGTTYSAGIRADPVLISGFELRVLHDPGLPLSPSANGFLTWFAVLPFGNDPEAEDAVRQWLSDSIGSDAAVRIRGYEYRLAGLEPGNVTLEMRAWPARAGRGGVTDG